MEMLSNELERLFGSLSDSTRIKIVMLVMERGEISVNEIAKSLGKSQSLISHHLACLRNCGILKVEKKEKYSVYSINGEEIRELLEIAIQHVKKYSKSILGCEVILEEKGKETEKEKIHGI
ncbi:MULTISPECIES: helix-turn-helix transcriptional regulator [Acidianus]|uniref:ArsR family transcriptional regulator n=1 Tax=Candidatus Acidianus copahuensis TaxID=1160895 RepID=A0A031LRP4_9CREN|nr:MULTISPECIES: metalloregulator ArsR/SmtB family transcription factor [Acidianus]EZQ10139.1 ArsR family transcriptional regulator [Candidatus Acidianus copahuensis]NON63369.1 winged helix-turn-helix transcriptional regulator [Acidianus sp. RZ1]